MADDDQWIDPRKPGVDITSGESVVAKMMIPRVLADHVEWRTDSTNVMPVTRAEHPFRIHDHESLVYTGSDGVEYLIEITAHLITEDEDAQRREHRAREARRLVRNPPADDAGQERIRNFYRSRLLDQEG